jgi:hypothetical protein
MPHPIPRGQAPLAATAKHKSRIISGWRQAPKPPGVSKPKAPPKPAAPIAPVEPIAPVAENDDDA